MKIKIEIKLNTGEILEPINDPDDINEAVEWLLNIAEQQNND